MENEKKPKNDARIEDLVEIYKHTSSIEDILKIIPSLLEYYENSGESNFRLNFWTLLSLEDQARLIPVLFNYLIGCSSLDKLIVLDLLKTLYTDADPEVREKLIYIFYAALMEKRNFKLALASLSFFSYLWKNSEPEDPTRGEIFPKLLDFIDNKDPLLASEGIFETLKLVEDTEPRERERLFETLLKIAETHTDPDTQYAAFEGLNQIIVEHLADLESFPPKILTDRVFAILQDNRHLTHPKAIYSLLRLIFGNKLYLTEKVEKQIGELMKKNYKHLSFEFQGNFWQSLFDFLQNAGFTSKTDIIAPYLKKLRHLFTHRSEIAPEVGLVIENIVTWLWDNEVLTEKERDGFY